MQYRLFTPKALTRAPIQNFMIKKITYHIALNRRNPLLIRAFGLFLIDKSLKRFIIHTNIE